MTEAGMEGVDTDTLLIPAFLTIILTYHTHHSYNCFNLHTRAHKHQLMMSDQSRKLSEA